MEKNVKALVYVRDNPLLYQCYFFMLQMDIHVLLKYCAKPTGSYTFTQTVCHLKSNSWDVASESLSREGKKLKAVELGVCSSM